MKYVLASIIVILITGCTHKEPVKLQPNSSEDVVNKGILLDRHGNHVPLDQSFIKQRYSYVITTAKKGNVYFDNRILPKAFYLLHHANLIVITGNRYVAKRYRSYLRNNGVTAPIRINATGIRSSKVIIDTIHYAPIQKAYRL